MKYLPHTSLVLLFMLGSNSFSQNTIPQNLNSKEKIGWISFDKNSDNPNFQLCDELNIEEYYQVSPFYGEGMQSIRQYFSEHQNDIESHCQEDGYIIVRFVINCQGETDRYRSRFMSLSYIDQVEVNRELQKKIVLLLRGMGNWTPGKYEGKNYDCYQHLKFLFKEGKLVDIMY